jgi:transcriptional regulator of acetoin/glycerol metabolism
VTIATTRHIDQVLAVVGGAGGSSKNGLIAKSWIRSANALGVDPGSRAPPRILTLGELRASQEASSHLIEMARAELDHLYKIVQAVHYVILLCDRDGRVIGHRGEEGEAAQFRHWGTWLGGCGRKKPKAPTASERASRSSDR